MHRWIRLLAAFAVAGLALTACGGDDGGDEAADDTTAETTAPADDAATDDGTTDTTVPVGAEVNIANFAFEPAESSVAAGAEIQWINEDGVPHTVTADDGAFDSGDIAGGGSFGTVIDEAGTYAYHCDIHPQMTGTVTVS